MAASSKPRKEDIIQALRDIARKNAAGTHLLKDLFEEHATLLNISSSSLRHSWQRLGKSGDIPHKAHGLRLLSDAQEETLLYTVQAFSAANLPLARADIQTIASRLWNLDLDRNATDRWLKRHKKDISIRKCVQLTKNRMDVKKMETDLKTFIGQVEAQLDKVKYPSHCVFNVDETRVAFKETGMAFNRIEWNRRDKHNVASSRQERGGTLVTFIAADGSVLFSVWIFKVDFAGQDTTVASFQIKAVEKTRTDGWPRYYGFNDTGYMNKDVWATLIDTFCERFNLLYPGMTAMLFSDQMASHLDPLVVSLAYQKNVHMWSLVANSSHFLQPLDDLPFGNFKKYTADIHARTVFAAKVQGESVANVLLPAAYEAEALAFTPDIIKGGFHRTGLFPFNKTIMWERFTLNTGKFSDTTRADQMRAAASAVIEAKHDESKKRQRPSQQVTRGRATVRSNCIFDPLHLIRAAEELETLEQEKVSAQQAAKLEAHCRADGCTKAHRGGSTWLVCECKRVRLCPDHSALEEPTLALKICDCQSLQSTSKKQRTLAPSDDVVPPAATPLVIRIPRGMLLPSSTSASSSSSGS